MLIYLFNEEALNRNKNYWFEAGITSQNNTQISRIVQLHILGITTLNDITCEYSQSHLQHSHRLYRRILDCVHRFYLMTYYHMQY